MYKGSLFFSYSQHLLSLIFLMIVILTSVGWYVSVVLICMYVVIRDTEHLLTCQLAICMLSLEKCLFHFSAHFLISLYCLFVFCHSVVGVQRDINPLKDIQYQYFLPCYRLPFHFVGCFFCCIECFSLK